MSPAKPIFLFDKKKLSHYPTQPGVYWMKNAVGETLYIGKAKSLRHRLQSYFQNPANLPPKIYALMRQVSHIEVQVVGSELEALLTEARLIKSHQPFFNKKIKDFARMMYFKIPLHAPYPAIQLVYDLPSVSESKPKATENAFYLGPFYGKGRLDARLETLNRIFQLRDCTETKFHQHAKNPCLQASLGFCSGPCAGLVSQERYQTQIADLLRFFQKQPCHALENLLSKRDAYAEALQFEKAAQLQQQAEQLEHLQNAIDRLLETTQRYCILILPDVKPDARRLLSVQAGQPHQCFRFHPLQDDWADLLRWLKQEEPKAPASPSVPGEPMLLKVNQAIPKAMYEESRLISSWIYHEGASSENVLHWHQFESVNGLFEALILRLSSPVAANKPAAVQTDQDEPWSQWEISTEADWPEHAAMDGDAVDFSG